MPLLNADQRQTAWNSLAATPWDLVVIGGGITGAGVLHAATAAGARVLLLEQRDFAWGTSSRSSKLVHGGLRYLANGQIPVTYESVQERRRLLAEAPELITPLGFVLPLPQGRWLKNLTYRVGVTLYDALGGWQQPHERLSAPALAWQVPEFAPPTAGALRYFDAQTDDARLVLRVIQDAVAAGATALNYAEVRTLLRDADGQVCGVQVTDRLTGASSELQARMVVNATGAWADTLRAAVDAAPRMRPLRGSHLAFAAWRLPVAQAVTLAHPRDGRPVFVLPWEGITVVGTTDCDHQPALNLEPRISSSEAEYLLAAVRHSFPALELRAADVLSTWAGVRPVIDTGAADPSRESRDHVIWQERGLLTVTGGKLTTFRAIAHAVLQALAEAFPGFAAAARPAFSVPSALPATLDAQIARRLRGRYGSQAAQVLAAAAPGELEWIAGTPTLWVELRWALRSEGVAQLDDLLLRRTHLGLMLPAGAAELFAPLQLMCAQELGWDTARWSAELAAYTQLIAANYALPPLSGAELTPPEIPLATTSRRWTTPAALAGAAALVWLWRRRRALA